MPRPSFWCMRMTTKPLLRSITAFGYMKRGRRQEFLQKCMFIRGEGTDSVCEREGSRWTRGPIAFATGLPRRDFLRQRSEGSPFKRTQKQMRTAHGRLARYVLLAPIVLAVTG